jgi:hypothetical protein
MNLKRSRNVKNRDGGIWSRTKLAMLKKVASHFQFAFLAPEKNQSYSML